jgi:hypothetical protein
VSDLSLLEDEALAEACGITDEGKRNALIAEVTQILERHTADETLERELSAKNQRDASIDLRKVLARALTSVREFRPEFARAVAEHEPPIPLETELTETIARLDAVIASLPTKAPTKVEDVPLRTALTAAARVFQQRSRWPTPPTKPQYRARLMEFVKATGLVPDASDLADVYTIKKKGSQQGRPSNPVLLRRLKRMIPSELLEPGPPVRRAG